MAETSTLTELNKKIERFKKVRFDVAHIKGELEVAEGELDNLKDEIMEIMKGSGAMSYRSTLGTLSINRKQVAKITDEVKVMFWLKNTVGLQPEDYMRLDKARAKSIVERAMIQDGEVLDGAEVSVSEYLSLREPKEK